MLNAAAYNPPPEQKQVKVQDGEKKTQNDKKQRDAKWDGGGEEKGGADFAEEAKGPALTLEQVRAQLYLESVVQLRSIGVTNIADFQPFIDFASRHCCRGIKLGPIEIGPTGAKSIKMAAVECGPNRRKWPNRYRDFDFLPDRKTLAFWA